MKKILPALLGLFLAFSATFSMVAAQALPDGCCHGERLVVARDCRAGHDSRQAMVEAARPIPACCRIGAPSGQVASMAGNERGRQTQPAAANTDMGKASRPIKRLASHPDRPVALQAARQAVARQAASQDARWDARQTTNRAASQTAHPAGCPSGHAKQQAANAADSSGADASRAENESALSLLFGDLSQSSCACAAKSTQDQSGAPLTTAGAPRPHGPSLVVALPGLESRPFSPRPGIASRRTASPAPPQALYLRLGVLRL